MFLNQFGTPCCAQQSSVGRSEADLKAVERKIANEDNLEFPDFSPAEQFIQHQRDELARQSSQQQSAAAAAAANTQNSPEKSGPRPPKIHSGNIDKKLAEAIIAEAPKKISRIIKILQHRDRFASLNIPKRILLVGPSGTGKTDLAKAIAAVCDMETFFYSSEDIGTSFQNSDTENVSRIFEQAKAHGKPCVVIFDELQAVLNKSKNIKGPGVNQAISLWSSLGQHEDSPIFFIGTLNYVNKVPKQIMSRFDKDVIEIPLPTQEQRSKVFQYYLEQQKQGNIVFDEKASAEYLASRTDGLSQRGIKNLIIEAAQVAIDRDLDNPKVTLQDCLDAYAVQKSADKTIEEKETWKATLARYAIKSAPHVINAAMFAANAYMFFEQFGFQKEAHKAQIAQANKFHNAQMSQANAANRAAANAASASLNMAVNQSAYALGQSFWSKK